MTRPDNHITEVWYTLSEYTHVDIAAVIMLALSNDVDGIDLANSSSSVPDLATVFDKSFQPL